MARVAFGGVSAADDDDDIRFGHCGYTTELTEQYVTTAQHMAKDLNDPYAYENKPIHYIPGYTGHLPLNRERFGVNYREASAATIAMQKAKGVHHPVTDLSAPAPNYVRGRPPCCLRRVRGHVGPRGGLSLVRHLLPPLPPIAVGAPLAPSSCPPCALPRLAASLCDASTPLSARVRVARGLARSSARTRLRS